MCGRAGPPRGVSRADGSGLDSGGRPRRGPNARVNKGWGQAGRTRPRLGKLGGDPTLSDPQHLSWGDQWGPLHTVISLQLKEVSEEERRRPGAGAWCSAPWGSQ